MAPGIIRVAPPATLMNVAESRREARERNLPSGNRCE